MAATGGTFKDGPFIGYVFGQDVEDRGAAFGYQVAYEVNRTLSFELLGSWHEDESLSLGGQVPTLSPGTEIDLDVIGIALSGRLAFYAVSSVSAYVGGGFGYYILEANNEEVRAAAVPGFGFVEADPEQEFGAHYVIGGEVLLTPHWECFLEFRQIFFDTDIDVNFAADKDTPVSTRVRDDFSYDHLMLRLGVNFRF